ncbi:SAM-dependent methyltransferase [Flavobacteriales bacterium 34_180_T64]|nr:SAM-dependent methyltransferase [Flavobacteriales bacterium 34_180_T64]
MSTTTNQNNLDQEFWENRYRAEETGWDLGAISPAIKFYIDQLNNKDIKILIPGGGHNYEAEYLWHTGFKNIYIVDIAEAALIQFQQRVPDFPTQQIMHLDFFKITDTFDLIIEQTFFCALDPNLRITYSTKMNQLLKTNGKLVGLLFDFELTKVGPPFDGDLNEYKTLFSNHFTIKTLETAFNSVKPRQNKELFFIFEKTS